MSIRHVIYTQVPGIDGTGITAIEKEQLVQRVESVAPPMPGNAADQFRTTVNGPRWLPPDTISPLLFDAAGDGVTDDYAAFMEAVDKVNSYGAGRIDLGARPYRINSTITFPTNRSIAIDGGGMHNAWGVPRGGHLIFPDGIDGLVFEARTNPALTNLGLTTPLAGSKRALGTGSGIVLKSQGATFRNVQITGFGLDGLNVTSQPIVSGVNADQGQFDLLACFYNGRDGVHLEGNDSNTLLFHAPNVIANNRYGVFDSAFYHNTFIAAHAYGNTKADYYVDSSSPVWINPYSEFGAGAPFFVIGPDSRNGTLIIGTDIGNGGAPIPHYDSSGDFLSILNISSLSITADPWARDQISSRGWTIQRNGKDLLGARFTDTVSGDGWRWRFGMGVSGDATMLSDPGDRQVFRINDTGSATSFQHRANTLGFYSQSPVAQPTVTGSRGGNAALASLLTALANMGLITNNTTN